MYIADSPVITKKDKVHLPTTANSHLLYTKTRVKSLIGLTRIVKGLSQGIITCKYHKNSKQLHMYRVIRYGDSSFYDDQS